MATVEAELATKTSALDKSVGQVASANAATKKLKNDLAASKWKFAAQTAQLGKVRKEAAVANAVNEESREQLANMKAELTSTTATLEKTQEAVAAAHAETKTTRERLATVEAELATKTSALDKSVGQVASANAATEQLKNDLAGVKSELTATTSTLDKARKDIVMLTAASKQANEEHQAEIANTKAKGRVFRADRQVNQWCSMRGRNDVRTWHICFKQSHFFLRVLVYSFAIVCMIDCSGCRHGGCAQDYGGTSRHHHGTTPGMELYQPLPFLQVLLPVALLPSCQFLYSCVLNSCTSGPPEPTNACILRR